MLYRGAYSYAHGGISLKKYLTPVLVVSEGVSNAPAAAITEISWKGLRCHLEVSGAAVMAVLISPEGRRRPAAHRGWRRSVSREIRPIVVAEAESAVSDVVANQVSMRELKTHLSEWLSRVQAGEVVEVTSHRKPIAQITAVNPAEPMSTNPLQKAIGAGLISWSGQKPNLPPPVKLNDGGPLMSDIVIEDRG